MRVVRYFLVLFSVSVRWKVTINKNATFTDCASGIWLLDCSKLAINWKNDNDVTICRHDTIVKFFDVAVFLLSSLITGPHFMSISLLNLKLRQFLSIRGIWPAIRKLEIPASEFWPTSWDWDKLWNTKFGTNVYYKMLLNSEKCQIVYIDLNFLSVYMLKVHLSCRRTYRDTFRNI